MAPGNELVLRGVLEAGKVFRLVDPIVTIGRDEASSIVLADGSTSLAHAEIAIIDGRATLRDVGSDTGTFYAKNEENVRRLAENESVMLRAGDGVSFGPGEAELYRVEQGPDGTLSKVDVGPPPELQAGSTTTVDHNDDDNSEDGEGDENSQQEDEQLADESVDETERSSGERYAVIVTVSRAEGLSGAASSSVFRRPKNKQMYVRVTMTEYREGGEQVFTADTSSVAGSGSTCSWGEKGRTGEAVSLQVDKGVLDSMKRTSLERVTEGTAVFELEVWSEAGEGGGEDVLLGRGQADLTFVDSKPRWVVLDPKGKVEISIATSLRESDGGEKVDANDRKSLSTQDGLTSALGSDHEQKGDPNTIEDTQEKASPDNVPKPSSPIWGLPRMPDLKDTLSLGLGRAAKLRGNQRAQASGDEANDGAVAIDSPAEDASQPADEEEDDGERQATIDNAPSDQHETPGKQASRVAIRGMQSIKESLQARLLGTSGKLSAGHEHAQNEEAAAESHEDNGARGLPSASREGTLSARSRASSNTAIVHDEAGALETSVHQDKVQKKRVSRDEGGSEPSTEDGGHAERGRSTNLRSLLQDTPAGDQGVRQSEDDKQDEADGADGDQAARRDSVAEETRESPAKGPVAQVVSALDAISTKAAAASASRFKSTLSSPSLTSTLKSFGWNRTKEEPVVDGLSSPSDASCEPVQTFSSDTTAGANEASEPATIQREGSFEPSSPSLEATTLLATIFRASGLPEVLANSKFGWARKNATQDPVVRLSACDIFASSSVVRGGGRECRWGTKKEGDIVELSIPSSGVPAEGLGALKLAVEVFNKASDEAKNDILVGRGEILVGDWLGKKAKWAALDAKRSQGGRVKLSLALKGSEKVGGVHRSSDASDDIVGNSSGDVPDHEVDEAGLTSRHPDATSALADGIVDVVQQTEEAPIQSEAEANNPGFVAQHDGQAPETAHVEGSNEGGFPVALASVSDGHQQQATLAEDDSSHVPTSMVEKNLDVQREEVENLNGSVGSTNDGSLSSDATKKEKGSEVGISVLVIEADSLHTRVSGNDGEAPKSDPYIVLHVGGENHATSAVIDGGAKCRWPEAGEAISFQTSYDALTAVGWGREGPFLTVEVYNQASPTREADVFIGSANVMLKEYLGVGPKWVDVHRRRKGRGRVLIDVKSPELQQDVPTTGHAGNPDTIGPRHADEEQVPQSVAVASGERRQSSSGVPEDSGPEGDSREDSEANMQGNSLDNPRSDPGKAQSTDHPRSTTSDGSSAGSLGNVRQKQERTSSGADLDAASSVNTVGSRILELSRQQSQARAFFTPRRDEGKIAGRADESVTATAQGADGGLVQDDENELEPFEARETPPDAGPVTEGNSHGLARRVVGGTAKALDLTTAACSSDQREASIADEQRAEIDTVITTVGRKERLETDNSQSSGQENDSWWQTSVPVAHEKNATSQQHAKERQGSSDLHAGGAPKVGTTDETSNGRPETPNEVVEALGTQPRERARIPRADPRRIKRAREIVRRRRTMVSNMGHASPRLRVASGLGTSTVEKARAATTIQGAFRGRTARRRLRVCQRAVVKIQAAYRGHVDRKGFVALSARSKRAKAEEQRAQARRSRMTLTMQELNLLRSTPAQQLLRVDTLRAEASACRIQRLWRRTHGITGVSQLDEDCLRDKARVGSIETRTHAVTAPEIFSRSARISVSGMSLEALRLRVANRQRAKERSRDGGQDAVLPLSTCERLNGTEQKPKAGGTVDATYKTLLQWQEKASQLSAVFCQSESERLAAAKRRRERLVTFKRTQEQLLHPPKLFRSDKAKLSAGRFENMASEDSRRRHILKIASDQSWAEAEEPARRDRAQRAHALAVAAANARGKKSWATSLPPDVGYDELVDIRTVVVPWPPTSVGRGGELDFADGFVRRRSGSSSERGSRVSDREFESDEASLWWYAYARTEGAHTTGLPQEDRVFAELLERVKTTPTRRKEQAEGEEQLYQLRVARQKQIAIDKVVHRHLVANCPSLSHARRRVTAAQRCAAVIIQAYIRGFLERKRTAVLRAEMRVFGALQVLVNELRQPELEAGDNTNSLAAILAEHVNGQSRVGEHYTGRRSRLPRVPGRGPATVLAAGSSD